MIFLNNTENAGETMGSAFFWKTTPGVLHDKNIENHWRIVSELLDVTAYHPRPTWQ